MLSGPEVHMYGLLAVHIVILHSSAEHVPHGTSHVVTSQHDEHTPEFGQYVALAVQPLGVFPPVHMYGTSTPHRFVLSHSALEHTMPLQWKSALVGGGGIGPEHAEASQHSLHRAGLFQPAGVAAQPPSEWPATHAKGSSAGHLVLSHWVAVHLGQLTGGMVVGCFEGHPERSQQLVHSAVFSHAVAVWEQPDLAVPAVHTKGSTLPHVNVPHSSAEQGPHVM